MSLNRKQLKVGVLYARSRRIGGVTNSVILIRDIGDPRNEEYRVMCDVQYTRSKNIYLKRYLYLTKEESFDEAAKKEQKEFEEAKIIHSLTK